MIPIDVVVANRNNARFLPQCLESIYRQTLQKKQIIVVDDASTDDSRLVLESHVREGRITLIQNDTVLGVAKSRSRAIAHGKSPFITTLDSDDYYYDTKKLEAEAKVIDGASRGRIGFSDVMRVNGNGIDQGLVSTRRHLYEGDLSFEISHLRGFIPRDYVVAREDYFAAGGYNSSLNLYEDWDLKIRLARFCTWHFSGVVGTAYRINPKGLSHSRRSEHAKIMRRIFMANCPEQQPLRRAAACARFFYYHSLYLGRPAI
jgi:glycosyltransferase involved in cell wall biosynthesis